jgi:hypothetical protein
MRKSKFGEAQICVTRRHAEGGIPLTGPAAQARHQRRDVLQMAEQLPGGSTVADVIHRSPGGGRSALGAASLARGEAAASGVRSASCGGRVGAMRW